MEASDARLNSIGRFHALGYRNFRLYWLGQLISLVGTWMQSVAQGWLMHRLTASAFMLGLLGFVQFLPVTLFSLWAGVVVDRMDKRRLLYVTQTAMLVQAVILATVVSAGAVKSWMVLALAMGFGIANAFDLPARQSFIVDLVDKPALGNAIALNSAAFNTARIFGPALAGFLVAVSGVALCFWLNAISYIAVLASLARLTLDRRTVAAREAAAGTLADGVRYAWSTGPIRNLLVLLACTAGLGFQYMILLPVYADVILHAGPRALGLLTSAFGLGALASVVRLTQKLDRWGLRRNLLIGLSTAGIGLAGFAWSRSLPLSMAAGFLAGFGLILYVASTNTLLQITTDDRYRGRVMSLYTLMFVGTAPIGALITGALAQRWGAPVATSFHALVLLLGALWITWRLRVLAAREAPSPQPSPIVEKVG